MVKYDLSNQRFGKLVALNYVTEKAMWLTQCDCGKLVYRKSYELRAGKRLSCGCGCKRSHPAHNKRHGLSDTASYNQWLAMKRRCYSKTCKEYRWYGERGIKMCERWLGPDGFLHFLSDMGEKPGKNFSIDRINNDGDYSPENCRWSTRKEQSNNQRTNIVIERNGERKTLTQWCEILGADYGVARKRYHKGIRGEELFLPPKKNLFTEEEIRAIRKYSLTKLTFKQMFGWEANYQTIKAIRKYRIYRDVI